MPDLSDSELRTLAAAYVRCSEDLRDDRDPDGIWSPEADPGHAAYDLVDRSIRQGPPAQAWALVRAILQAADDVELAFHAAGPLEDLVRHQATEVVDLIEAEAARDPRFRWALGQIWMPKDEFPPDVETRLVRASGGVIKPLV
jgi:hypothetical protein